MLTGSRESLASIMHNKHTQPPSAPGIDALWMQKTGRSKHLTPKEQGQLHSLSKEYGASAYLMVDYVIDRWFYFRIEVEQKTQWEHSNEGTVNASPIQPHIGFLRKHCGIAMNQLLDSLPPGQRHTLLIALKLQPLTPWERKQVTTSKYFSSLSMEDQIFMAMILEDSTLSERQEIIQCFIENGNTAQELVAEYKAMYHPVANDQAMVAA